MYNKSGNLLLIDGYYIIQPDMYRKFQDGDLFMAKVFPDQTHTTGPDPEYQGIVFPSIYQYPDTPATIGKQKARVLIEVKFDFALP